MSYFAKGELARLDALRRELLAIEGRPAGKAAPRYWRSAEDLRVYDETFARRIAWKWEAVLDELERRSLLPQAESVLDWGAGTGVASRAWLARRAARQVTVWDRDERAREYAAARVRDEVSETNVRVAPAPPDADHGHDLVLVSHVLDELEDSDLASLLDVVRGARAVIWVEPGSRITSRRLSEAREELLRDFDVLAPCPHAARCGMLAEDQQRNWCHHFARPPQEVYTDGRWAEFGRELGIDLRSVPYSFLVLGREERAPEALTRILGRPRVQRGRALIDTCAADGVRAEAILQRVDKSLFKKLGDSAGRTFLLELERDGERIVRAELKPDVGRA